MKWFQVDSDTPNDPKIRAVFRALGVEGIGGMFLLWCFIADHGTKRPGWSIDSSGRPIAVEDLRDASKLEQQKFDDLVAICISTGHFEKRPWTTRKVIAIPAMASRADTYTRRRVRTDVEDGSQSVPRVFGNKTRQHKTTQEERTRLTPPQPVGTPDENRKVIRALVRDVVRKADPHASFADLKEMAKEACAGKLAYDADVVGSALEQALARRTKAS